MEKIISNLDGEKPLERILYLEIDTTPEIEEFVSEIVNLSTEEKLIKVSEFIKSKFKNAISPHNIKLSKKELQKIQRVLKQEPKKLSKALSLEYGVCVEYHVLGKAIFDKLGIPCEFKKGRMPGGSGHTFLDVQINGEWQIFDPFAEVYLNDTGEHNLKLLSPVYYESSKSNIIKK